MSTAAIARPRKSFSELAVAIVGLATGGPAAH